MVNVFCQEAVGHHRIELDHHIQYTVFPCEIPEGCPYGRHRCFADLDGAVFPGNLPEFLQVRDQVRAVLVKGESVDGRQKRDAVRQTGMLGNIGDYIFPEAVHTHIQPEAHNTFNFVTYLWVIHVQIRLFFSEHMQIILLPQFIIFPGEPFKLAEPVVRRALSTSFPFRIPPYVIITVGIVFSFSAFQKPWVFVRGVVDDQIQNHLQAKVMCLVQHFPELFQVAVIRVDVFVIGNVITEVRVRRRINRTEPYAVHSEGLYIFQLVVNAVQIPDPIIVTVAKTAYPDLIDRHTPEIKLFHDIYLFQWELIS